MKLFEIPAYRYALRDTGAVIKFQYRDRRKQILFSEFGTAVDCPRDVDFFVRNLNALLGEKDTNAAADLGRSNCL